MQKQIKYYYTKNGDCPYLDWYNELDKSIQLRVLKRVEKLENGLYGDFKKLQQSELSELRMDFGKGYRIYYLDLDDTLIIFFAGSEKKDQKKIVKQANTYYEEFMNIK
jgi:putative addiction module killer protein